MFEDLKDNKGIQLSIPISIKKIKKEELESLIQNFKQNRSKQSKKSSQFDISYHIKKIKDRDENLAAVLSAINDKLDRILHILNIESDYKDDLKEQIVFLKSDQIIFIYTEELTSGDLVEIKFGLEYDKLTCFGEVQSVNIRDNTYVVLAKLIWVTEEDQDKFVEFLFRQQILNDRIKRGLKKD